MGRIWTVVLLSSCQGTETVDDKTSVTDTGTRTGTETGAQTDTDTVVPPVETCLLTVDQRYGSDGTLLQEQNYSYDADRFLVQMTIEFGTFEDPPDTTIYYTNDAQGRATLEETDSGSDGTIEAVETTTYDGSGHVLEVELDLPNDGVIDFRSTYTYDGMGRIVLYEYDNDPSDGAVELVTSYTYNVDGDLWVEEQRNDTDAVLYVRTYFYDDLGQLLGTETDSFGDGTINFTNTYTYDAAGNVLTSLYANAQTGEEIQLGTYTYDANGNVLTWLQEFPDSTILSPNFYTYTYDAFDNLVLLVTDAGVDGLDLSEHTWTWDCPSG